MGEHSRLFQHNIMKSYTESLSFRSTFFVQTMLLPTELSFTASSSLQAAATHSRSPKASPARKARSALCGALPRYLAYSNTKHSSPSCRYALVLDRSRPADSLTTIRESNGPSIQWAELDRLLSLSNSYMWDLEFVRTAFVRVLSANFRLRLRFSNSNAIIHLVFGVLLLPPKPPDRD
jgi:hypothetical protein